MKCNYQSNYDNAMYAFSISRQLRAIKALKNKRKLTERELTFYINSIYVFTSYIILYTWILYISFIFNYKNMFFSMLSITLIWNNARNKIGKTFIMLIH